MITLVFSFILLVLAYFLIPKTKWFLVFFCVLNTIYFLISILFLAWYYFTWKWIDESVIYHLFYWLEWAWVGSDYKIILIILAPIILYFLSLFWIFKLKKFFEKKTSKIIFFIFILTSFWFHPIFKNFYDMWYFSFIEAKTDIKYEIPKTDKKIENTKNLVFIYLESFEKLYLDENIFPGLAQNLQKLREENTSFENLEMAFWTSWTIAWMVGWQCWTPLINSGWGGNSMHWIEDFLPGAFCMWDFLKKYWYDLNYMWWADLSFAWKWNFYKTHSFNSIEWKKELEKKLKDRNSENEWWLYDNETLNIAFEKYKELNSKNKKFALFMLTLDTHWNDNFVSKTCPKTNLEPSMLNSYKCSDFLIWEFIKKIQAEKNSENTTIVLVSDHLAMNNNNSVEILNKHKNDRKNLFLILDWKKQKIEKKWTTLDIWVTVLNSMGFNLEKLWYWVNLFSEKTISLTNKILRQNKNEFEKFWSYPSIKNGISFDLENKKISINWKNIWFPTLIFVGKTKDTEKILWEDKDSWNLIEKKEKNSIFLSFYTDWTFCATYWKNNRKCFEKSWKINYEEIIQNLFWK